MYSSIPCVCSNLSSRTKENRSNLKLGLGKRGDCSGPEHHFRSGPVYAAGAMRSGLTKSGQPYARHDLEITVLSTYVKHCIPSGVE